MKTTIKTGLTVILSLAISCTKENIKTSSTATRSTDKAVAAHYIGEHYGGGIIFYLDSTGQRGLIADTVDLPASPWRNGVNSFTSAGAYAKHIGAGKSNTEKIISALGDSGKYAARRCWHLTRNGYKDWFLPSRSELDQLYKQKDVVGGFRDGYYWSSSEIAYSELSYDVAWSKNFADGIRCSCFRTSVYYVRAVRAF